MDEPVIFHLGENGLSFPTDAIFANELSMSKIKDTTVYININTLIRNALNAYDDKHNLKGSLNYIVERITTDIMLCKEYLRKANTHVVVYDVIYINLCKGSFTKYLNLPDLKRTERQQALHDTSIAALELVKSSVELSFERGFKNTDNIRDAFIVTHYPIDLLKHNSFNSLQLIDSFTGNIKSFSKFNTKLNLNPEQKEYIPFCEAMLKMFGDGVLIGGQPKAAKAKIMEIAKRYNWTPLSTESRVLFCIDKTDKPLADVIKLMIRK